MTVRPATHSDIPAIIALGRAMHDASPVYRAMPWDDEQVRSLLCGCVTSGACFVAMLRPHWNGIAAVHMPESLPVGFIAGFTAQTFFGPTPYVADLTLYVATEYRGNGVAAALLAAWDAWWPTTGARFSALGVSAGIHDERALALYAAAGYVQTGVTVSKAL